MRRVNRSLLLHLFPAFLQTGKKFFPDRVPGHNGLPIRKVFLRLFEGDKDPLTEPLQNAIGHPRHHILFMDGPLHPEKECSQKGRTGGISSNAQDELGLKFLQDRASLRDGHGKAPDRFHLSQKGSSL